MGESSIHKHFIDRIYTYILKIIPNNHSKLIYMDCDKNLLVNEIPPIINGFRPDLYYEFNSLLIIGEAKTKNDYSTKHSINQYKEYIKYCNNYDGKSYLVLCCPWKCVADLKCIVKKIEQNYEQNINIIFLDELNGE